MSGISWYFTQGSSCARSLNFLTFYFAFEYLQNLKVHENRRQLYSSTASKETSNPFVRQRPLAAKAQNGASAPPWANAASTSSSLFPR